MVKLEENGYVYLQSALDHNLEKIFHDEITDFISIHQGIEMVQSFSKYRISPSSHGLYM